MADETVLIKIEVEGVNEASQSTAKLSDAIEKQTRSIKDLREENKQLTKARNEVNLNSEEGRKKLSELNAQLDKNNETIKKNVDSYTKQKIGIGDYKGALDKLVPGLGATATGFQAMTTKAMAFVATPLGAVITALGLAIGALTQYFKSTGEGEDKLKEITSGLSVVFEGLMRVVEMVGKLLFKTIEFIGAAAMKIIELVSPASAAAIESAMKAGQAIAKLDDEIDARSTEMIIKRADTENQVAKLRARAVSEEGATKRATIEQAIKLEKDLSQAEVELAQKRVELWQKQHATKTDLTDEEKRQQAELSAAAIAADTAAYENTLRLKKELEGLDNAADKRQAEAEATNQAIEHKNSEGANFIAVEDAKMRAVDGTVKFSLAAAQRQAEEMKKIDQKRLDAAIKAQEKETRVAYLEGQNRLANISQVLGQAAGLMDQNTAAYKALAISRASVDTYRAANAALAENLGFPWGLAAMITTIGIGLANVSRIAGFAGGGSFLTKGPQMIMVGDNPGGVERVDVTPVSGKGETVWGGNLLKLGGGGTVFAGDGGLGTNTAVQDINQMAGINDAISKIQIFASWTEGMAVGNAIQFKEQISTA